MNKKGFTLVELLGVLIIMSIVLIVVITPIMGQIRNNSKKLDDAALKLLYASTDNYLDGKANLYPKNDGMTYYVPIGQLIDTDNLESNYLSSYSEEVLSRDDVIKVIVENGGYEFSFAEDTDGLSTLYNAYQNVENDSIYSYLGGTYFSGSASNNYVYYSGFMWRIMGINEDGSIKLIADEPVTTLNFGDANNYDESYANEWLNNYFISRLKYSDFLVEESACYVPSDNVNISQDACESLNESALGNSKVTLLSLYEYNMSILNNYTYLRSGFIFATSTYSSTLSDKLFKVLADGSITADSKNSMHYIRPVISLMPESTITGGDGTKNIPYMLFKSSTNIVESDNRTLNSINLAIGDYISLNDKIYRVVESNNSETKLILNELYEVAEVDYSSTFGSSSVFNTNEGVAGYLKDSLYFDQYTNLNGIVKTTFWYQGDSTVASTNYKNSSLAKTNILYGISVGIPKIGEILTAPVYGSTIGEFWTMSKSSNTEVYVVTETGSVPKNVSLSSYIRPVIVIEAEALIRGGIGTNTNPYIINF